MIKILTTEELKKKIDEGKELYLIDVLSKESFEARHIPSAKNIPYDGNFTQNIKGEIGEAKDTELIVYCSSASCIKSVQAAETLESNGYTNVLHYKDGLAGWQDTGLQFAKTSE